MGGALREHLLGLGNGWVHCATEVLSLGFFVSLLLGKR